MTRAVAAALAVHVLMAALMVIGTMDWQPFRKPQPTHIAIEAVIVDKNGMRVHSSRERIYLSHTNPQTGGYLLKDHGTPDKSSVIEAANGRAVILFDPDGAGSGAIIEARTQNLKGSYIELP